MTNLIRCTPTYATRRRPERESFGPELVTTASKLRQPMMPWQRLVADVAGEIDPRTGLPAYREIFITVPRQSGKTTLFLSFQVHRCLSPRWEHPQRTIFTAQTGKDARDKWLDELFPQILGSPEINKFVTQYNRGMANEHILWKTKSILRLSASAKSSGHSKSIHQAVLDELWHDVDYSREQGLRPAMITMKDAQILGCSTAGTDASVVYNQKVKAGRAAVRQDSGEGLAYFEFSAPGGKDWDPDDEDTYFTFMPALCPDPKFRSHGCHCDSEGVWGHTIGIEVIRAERQSLPTAEFMRAYGNVPQRDEDPNTIPMALFEQVVDEEALPTGGLTFALDVAEDRSASAILCIGENGVIEMVDYLQGTSGLVRRAVDLAEKWDAEFVIDGSGPAANYADELDDEGVSVTELTAGDMTEGTGSLYDAIANETVVFTNRGKHWPHMIAAVEGLIARQSGDRKVWSRSMSKADISPIMGATCLWVHGGDSAPFFL